MGAENSMNINSVVKSLALAFLFTCFIFWCMFGGSGWLFRRLCSIFLYFMVSSPFRSTGIFFCCQIL